VTIMRVQIMNNAVVGVFAKYKHHLITCLFYSHIMNGKALVIGIFLFALSVFGYVMGPSMLSQMMNMFTPGGTGSINSAGIDPYKMMGIPRPEELAKMAQYSFLGLMFAGIGVLVFGAMAKKKKPKKVPANLENEMASESQMRPQVQPQVKNDLANSDPKHSQRTLAILEERLAMGEITTKEYVNLKRLITRS